MKCWILFDDKDCEKMWKESLVAVNTYLADETDTSLWYGHSDMDTGKRVATKFGALDAFFPAVLALSGDRVRAAKLEYSCYQMWNVAGVEPEVLDYSTMKVARGAYYLNPEIMES
ncbi:MAG: glycoside hydrolase family 47 protein, partial [Ignavibacteriales bacterium]|nr:glycoside hydrolase family 47 protein [Ignavibacteriales bacterium]